MPVRGLLVGVILLALLGGGVYWSERSKEADEAKEAEGGSARLVRMKDEEVRKIEIRRTDNPPIVLERDKSDKWQMSAPQNWRVDEEAVNGLASAYANLSYDRVIDEKGADLAGYGLSTPSVQVVVTAKDGKSRTLLLGEETPTGTGTYAKFEGDPKVFTIATNTKVSLDKTQQDLRDKRLLVFDTSKLTRVELASRAGAIEFGRNAHNEWQIVRPKPQRADNSQVEELVRKLSDARMEAAIPADEAARFASSFPFSSRVGTATLTDGSGGTQSLEIRKRGEDYLAKSTAVDGVFKVPAELGEALNKGLDDFRNKKLFDFGFNDPSKVEAKAGDTTYVFTKSGENWTNASGKQVDATSVQSLIDKLRDLAAIKIQEYGFATPVVEAAVTSEGGQRNERVLISKTRDRYFAIRQGEPTVYELDANAVDEIQRAAADVKEPPPPAPPTPPAKK
jgi:hypothetical protein